MKYQSGSVFSKTKTATADTPFQVETRGSEEGETILTSVNIHCATNDAYYGSLSTIGIATGAIIRANAVVWFDGTIKISDLWFKNYTPGSNCVITVVGIVK